MTRSHQSTADLLSDRDLLILASNWRDEGREVALAFVMRTWGSAPRQAGAVMIVDKDMHIAGSVSGGCIEGAVIEAALNSMETGKGEQLKFGVADETAWSVGLSCGGEITILLTPITDSSLPAATLKKMAALCAARQPLRITFDAQSGVAGQLESGLSDKDRQASFLEDDDAFTLYYPPPPHLILIGAVHISQHLAQMAAQCGFEVSIIDPRGIFTSAARFPETVRIYKSWPSEILDRLPLDRATAMVTLTHDPKIDDDGLLPALASPLFYLACLGSKRTHAKRQERLAEKGITPHQFARISGPAGLDIGAKSPAEIAASILAELIAAWRASLRAPETSKGNT